MLRSWAIVLACLGIAAGGGWYAARVLRIDTDTAALLAADLPFRQAQLRFQREFPGLVDVYVAVVTAPTAERADVAAGALAAALHDRTDIFRSVTIEERGPWFQRNALLFLDETELREAADRLIAAQPLIGMLANESSLAGFAGSLSRALDGASSHDTDQVEKLLGAVLPAFAASPAEVSWRRLLQDERSSLPGAARTLLRLEPRLDFSTVLAAQPSMDALRAAARDLERRMPGVGVRVTGDAAIAHEELEAAWSGSVATGALTLVAVAALLIAGLRSARMGAACLVTLIAGLLITAGFATLAVGRLNLISLAFAVLYLGLAADYAIHYCLDYRSRSHQAGRVAALAATRRALGRALGLCALTTACGFLAFLPTPYRGVAELGLIAAAGMLINLLLTFTLLPALLALLPLPGPWRIRAGRDTSLVAVLATSPATTIAVIAMAALAAGTLAPRLGFDRDPLNLRDPRAESIVTLRELMAERGERGAGITVLARDQIEARDLAERLRALPEVDAVVTLDDVVPEATPEHLALVDELALLIDTRPPPLEARAPSQPETMAALDGLRAAVADYAGAAGGNAADALAAALAGRLVALRAADETERASALRAMESAVFSNLPAALASVEAVLAPDADPLRTLPDSLRSQWIGSGGSRRILVLPAEPLGDEDSLRRFVDAVQSVAPAATDEPVLNLRAGDAIVDSFRSALLTASVAIVLILIMALRSVVAVVTVVAPLLLATLFTGATMVLLDMPLNFANVIALPLLFGMGVDGGIHVAERSRRAADARGDPGASITARAIAYSGLTTLAGFGSLVLAPHPGMASLGSLLTLGVLWLLLTTLAIGPTLRAALDRKPV